MAETPQSGAAARYKSVVRFRVLHDFLKWMWPAIFGGAVTLVTVALGASAIWTEAKNWTAGLAIDLWGLVMAHWILFPASLLAITLLWFWAFLWSGHKLTAPSEAPVSGVGDPQKRSAVSSLTGNPMLPLKDHFEKDFRDGKGEVILETKLDQDIEFDDGYKTKIFYNQQMRFGAHAMFLVVYIPPCGRTEALATYIADNIDAYKATGDIGFQIGGVGHEETRAEELIFTGKVIIYHEDRLTLEEQGRLDAHYRSKGLVLQLRSRTYVLSVMEGEALAKAEGRQ